MPFVAGKKTPVTAGMKTLKKMAEPQAGYGEQWNGVGLKKHEMSQHQPKNSSLAESPKAGALILLTKGSLTNFRTKRVQRA